MNNLWLPYFSISDNIPFLKVKTAQGCKIILEDGSVLIDGISSWWSVCHGYQHPFIVEKIKAQISKLSHIMLGGMVHEPAIEFSVKLINFLEAKYLQKVFFSDSGSTAVEVGIKMALQFFHEAGNKSKKNILYFKDGYHGETLGALSFSHSTHSEFPSLSNKILAIIPETEEEFKDFETLLLKHSHTIAGAMIEPILQGAGGMKIHSVNNINRLWKLLKQYNILIIADECATGFYRLGAKFAFHKIGIEPDILILGKALTAGYVPFACTIATEEIFNTICTNSRFFHGPTFMGNPIACSAGIANIELFEKENYDISVIENAFTSKFKNQNARIIGAVCAFDITKEQNIQIKKNVAEGKTRSFLRPFGTTLYTMPSLCINKEELDILMCDLENQLKS